MSNLSDPETTDPRTPASQPLARALLLLDALAASPNGASLDELTDMTSIPRSSTHRIVRSLVTERMIVASRGDALYFLGPRCIRHANRAQQHLLASWAPALSRLSEAVNEVVDVSMLTEGQVEIIHQIAVPHRLQAVAHTGDRLPAHATASGKAILSLLPAPEAAALLPAPLPKLTSSTLATLDLLHQHLDDVRAADAVAFEYEEYTVGISGVAAAFWSPLDVPVAIGIPVPAARFSDREKVLVAELRACRDEIRKMAEDRDGRLTRTDSAVPGVQ